MEHRRNIQLGPTCNLYISTVAKRQFRKHVAYT